MSLLDVNLDDVPELEHLPDNTEIMLRVKRAEITEQKKNPKRYNVALVLDVPERPLVDDVRVWVPVPSPEQRAEDPKAFAKTAGYFKEFLAAFRVEMPIDVSDLLGKEAWGIVSEDINPNSGLPQNGVRRFVARR